MLLSGSGTDRSRRFRIDRWDLCHQLPVDRKLADGCARRCRRGWLSGPGFDSPHLHKQVLTKKWHRSRRNTRLSGPEGLGGGFSVALTSKAVRRGVWVAPLDARKPRTWEFGAGVVGPGRAWGQVQAAGLAGGGSVLVWRSV